MILRSDSLFVCTPQRFRRLSLVQQGYLTENEKAYTYKTAENMGLVCNDEQNETFRLATEEERKTMNII